MSPKDNDLPAARSRANSSFARKRRGLVHSTTSPAYCKPQTTTGRSRASSYTHRKYRVRVSKTMSYQLEQRANASDLSYCSTVSAPTRIQTREELEEEKVAWRWEEDRGRRHAPRNIATTFMHMATVPAVVAARRFSNRSRNPNWSFRDEAATTWLHFSLGTQDHTQWRRLMWMGKVFGKVRAGSLMHQRVDEPGISGYWFDDPKDLPVAQKDIVWLYFHGGGYIAGDPMMHVSAIKHLFKSLREQNGIRNIRILAVKYPLAPENAFPSQANTALAAYKWLLQVHKTPADKIIVGGDSAGGNLTLALLQRIRAEQLPMAQLCVLISPWVEMLLAIPEGVLTRPQLSNDILSVRCSRPTVLAFLGQSGVAPSDPMISPVNMDFTGMPSMVVQWGGRELFSQQIREFCSRAEDSGLRVLRDRDPDMSHVYQMLVDLIGDRSKRGLERLAGMVARMVVEDMGSDGRGGGAGPRRRPEALRPVHGNSADWSDILPKQPQQAISPTANENSVSEHLHTVNGHSIDTLTQTLANVQLSATVQNSTHECSVAG